MPLNHQDTKPHKISFEPIPFELEESGKKIVHAAYLVHSALGPGLLEKVYEICFCHELMKMGLLVSRQVDIPMKLADKRLGYLINFNVANIGQGIKRYVK